LLLVINTNLKKEGRKCEERRKCEEWRVKSEEEETGGGSKKRALHL
jgi:hypothetical protein